MSIKATDFIHILPIVSVMTFIIREKNVIFSALGFRILNPGSRVTFCCSVSLVFFNLEWFSVFVFHDLDRLEKLKSSEQL